MRQKGAFVTMAFWRKRPFVTRAYRGGFGVQIRSAQAATFERNVQGFFAILASVSFRGITDKRYEVLRLLVFCPHRERS